MIQGRVTAREARIRLKVQGPRRVEQEIEAAVDTGYTGALTLPPAVVTSLALRWDNSARGILADGSECLLDVYVAQVVWDRKVRRVFVNEAEAHPLVGMALLNGHELKIQVRSGGKVTIKRLPKKPHPGP